MARLETNRVGESKRFRKFVPPTPHLLYTCAINKPPATHFVAENLRRYP
jgi:hypothetical protein